MSAHQFARLWAEVSSTPMPYPLRRRESAPTVDEQRAHQRELDDWADALDDKRLRGALAVLSAPDVAIEATVSVDGGRRDLRLLGARRASTAVLAEQVCGEAGEVNRDIRVFTGAADELAGSLMQAIPDVRPGAQRTMSLHEDDLTSEPDPSVFQQVRSTDTSRARTLLRAPRQGVGHIAVLRHDNEVGALRWVDVAEDGRYLIHGDGHLQIRPASLSGIHRELSRCLAGAR
ncbi:hypothetical protein G4X40_14085 [Rhodococcus sp. D2-41]|nr:hypothetical protein [Rhodococcus sp. D2-41]